MNNAIQFLVATLMFLVVSPILAHVSPEHVLSLSHNSTNSWNLFEISLLISTLLVVIGFLSKKQKMDKG
ncbi:MAG: hypothetical protein NZ702_01355 [Gammaproteobacteria bacterium]|nr:hypothetical protein [Gammaproteobacteria bacterium]